MKAPFALDPSEARSIAFSYQAIGLFLVRLRVAYLDKISAVLQPDAMGRSVRVLFGLFFTGLGIVGAFLPVLPSTCFFIFAAYFFASSSPRMERWLLEHPRFGPTVKAWQETRSISFIGKLAASVSMFVSGLFLLVSPAALLWKLVGIAVLAASAAYVLSRPTLQSPLPSKKVISIKE